jgi:hypothetical protein
VKRVLPAGVKNCPRCDHYIPSDENPGAYVGAISRTDNETEICSACGTAEALEEFLAEIMPQEEWVKNRASVSPEFAGDVLDIRKAEEMSSCAHDWEPSNCEECEAEGVNCNLFHCYRCGESVEMSPIE